jgi:hypothetical protein
MLRTMLWIAAACVAVLLALYVSRTLHFDRPAPKPAPVVAAAPPPKPPAAKPPPPVAAPKPPPTPEELQIQEDAAATGMTTIEPDDAPKDQTSPPT